MSPQVFGFGAGSFYAYLIFEVPSNYIWRESGHQMAGANHGDLRIRCRGHGFVRGAWSFYVVGFCWCR
jgi:hypothetical protein